jgi:hypothetical protein
VQRLTWSASVCATLVDRPGEENHAVNCGDHEGRRRLADAHGAIVVDRRIAGVAATECRPGVAMRVRRRYDIGFVARLDFVSR